MQNTNLCNIIIVDSEVILGGIALEPWFNQLVTSTIALADSPMMMQLCCHYWEVKNLQQWA